MFKIIQMMLLAFFITSFSLEGNASIFPKKANKAEKINTQVKPEKKDKKEEKKILLVEIYASWCPGCKNIQPTLDQVLKEVSDIELVQLDVSTPSKSKIAEKRANELNIKGFYQANKSKTATVGIIIPFKNDIVSVFHNNNSIDDYKIAIQEAKTKQKVLDP